MEVVGAEEGAWGSLAEEVEEEEEEEEGIPVVAAGGWTGPARLCC